MSQRLIAEKYSFKKSKVMPLNYSIVLLGNPRKPDDPKKAYARSQVSKELTLKGLSQRVAAQTTVSRADVSAV